MNNKEREDKYGKYRLLAPDRLARNPSVSIVMAVYNGEDYVHNAIEAILSQTYIDFEFIILNDGSIDGTQSAVEEYFQKDQRIILIQQENIGLTKSLNRGLSIASGKFIARQDADDISLPYRLEKQVKKIEDYNADILGSNADLGDTEGCDVQKKRYCKPGKVEVSVFFNKNPLPHSGILIKKFEGLQYNDNFKYAQDLELYLRSAKDKIIYFDDEILVSINKVKGQLSDLHHREQVLCGLRARWVHLCRCLTIKVGAIFFTYATKTLLALIFKSKLRINAT